MHKMDKVQQAAYRQPQWKEFSRRVIEANQCRCSQCHRHESEGITLQVHHTYYKPELFKYPWDYPLKAFEVLCKGCHAKEHGHIMPTEGWEYVEGWYEDMKEPCFPCEYPGCSFELRHVHTIYHPKWGYLNVGCVHADILTGTKQASEVEKEEKRRHIRLESFLNPKKWQKYGNHYYQEFVHFPITITQENNVFQVSIFIPLVETYTTLEDAQKAAFNICYNVSPRQFFEQHNIPYPEMEIRKPRSKKNPVLYRDQLTFAISNQTGQLVHIDSVEPDIMCNCVCPGCGKPLKAEVSSERREDHRFVHLYEPPCDDFYVQMYRRLALQLIEQNKHIWLPSLENTEAELYLPDSKIQLHSIQYPSAPFDALVTYLEEGIEKQIGILIDIDHSSIDEQLRQAKSFKVPVLQISLIKQFNTTPPLKLKELQELLLNTTKIYSWRYNPDFDKKVVQLCQEKQDYLNLLQTQIQQNIDNYIIDIEEQNIRDIAEIYQVHERYSESVKRLFRTLLEKNVERIICEPTPEDLANTPRCDELIRWYQQYNTYQGENYTLTSILRGYDFVLGAKQGYNHTIERFHLLHNIYGYFFFHNIGHPNEEDYARYKYDIIRKKIREPFVKHSPLFSLHSTLSKEQKIGMELCFLLYLYYGVAHFSWNGAKKAFMFRQINKTENLPIFAAVGSLWFGHIFNCFQTDDFQTFINTIFTQYPQAAPWVLTYIENTNYFDYCRQNNISYKVLEQYREEYNNKWIAGVLYSTLSYYYDSKNIRHELFPKVSLS